MRYSSMLGNFFFDENVPPSKAKLLRDTVTGQYFNPKPGDPKITTEASALEFMHNHPSRTLAEITFDIEILV